VEALVADADDIAAVVVVEDEEVAEEECMLGLGDSGSSEERAPVDGGTDVRCCSLPVALRKDHVPLLETLP